MSINKISNINRKRSSKSSQGPSSKKERKSVSSSPYNTRSSSKNKPVNPDIATTSNDTASSETSQKSSQNKRLFDIWLKNFTKQSLQTKDFFSQKLMTYFKIHFNIC